MAKRSILREKEQEYWEYRDISHTNVAEILAIELNLDVQLTDISDRALQIVTAWRSFYRGELSKRAPGWIWEREVKKYRRHYQRVELAIWSGSTLCGLMIGRVSDRRVVASIHLIESNPGTNPLQGNIAVIGTRWLIAFAMTCKCKEVAIDRPIPELMNYYRSLGFTIEISRKKKVWRLKKILDLDGTKRDTRYGGNHVTNIID